MYYFTIVRVYRCFHVRMDAPVKNVFTTSLGITYRTQLITSWVETDYSLELAFSKLVQFHIHPPLNILTPPDWLNVKFHYFLIGPKVKFFNTLKSIGSYLCNVVPSVITLVNSFTRPTGFC